jgi:hypothetical protein
MTPDDHRLGNLTNLSCREIHRRKPVRDIDFFYRVGPIIHSARNANDNTILPKVKKRVLAEPDKTRITVVETGTRASVPQDHPR